MNKHERFKSCYDLNNFTLHLLNIMRVLMIFLGLGLSSAYATSSYAQTKIDINVHDASLVEFFKEIQQNTDFVFFYKDDVLANNVKVSVNLEEASLAQVLQTAFLNTSLSYKIADKQVVVKRLPKRITVTNSKSQQKTITVTGTITESDSGMPIPGANIMEQGTSNGVMTDFDGNYSIEVPKDATLEVSYVGFAKQQIKVNGRSEIDVALEKETSALDEVVVVGYGTQKKVNLTGAISTLDMSTKKGQPITNASNALYGVSGLHVNLVNSAPGVDRAQIRVRGIGNLNATGSGPLVLVDGIEYPLNELNPEDIKDISVLKDASAAIYGSKAANGVVLVTTKKGKGEYKVNYNSYYGIQQATFMPDAIWDPIEYMKLFNQAELNEGKTKTTFSENQIHEYEVGMHLDPTIYPSNDWFDKSLKNGQIQKHNISVSKGTDEYSYRLSLGYLDREGVFKDPNNREKKYYYGLNTSLNLGKRLKVGFDLKGNYRSYKQPAYGTGTYMKSLMRSLPIMPDVLQNGDWAYTWLRVPGRNNWENPMMYANEGNNEKTQMWTVASINADYKLPFNITYKLKLGVNKYDALQDRFIPKMTKYQVKTGEDQVHNGTAPQSYNYDNNNLELHFYNTLNWDREFKGGHDLGIMLGGSFDNYNNTSFNAQMRGYSDNTLEALDAGNDPYAISGHPTEDVLQSYFGRLNYNFKGKYLLEGIFRFDGSSRFAQGHRWGFFPGVSAGWRIDKEPFLLNNTDFFDLLKLRASVGQAGNQAVALYSYESDVTLGHDYSFGGTNGALVSGAASTALADPTTSWETTTNYDVGLDVSIFQNRLGLTVDLYKKLTKGLLRTVNIPDQVGGLSGAKRNVGSISNKGYEIGLNYKNHIGDFNYSIYGDVSYNKNRVEDLNGEILYNNSNSGISSITEEGRAVSSYYLYEVEGIFQSEEEVANHAYQSGSTKPGYLKYKDVNEDGKIDEDDRVAMDKSTVTPKYNYSFGIDLGYKGLSLSAYLQGVGGYYLLPRGNFAYPFNNGAGATWEWAKDSWTPDRPDAKLPIVTEASYGNKDNFKQSDFWLKNASYLRLKNVQLSYAFPGEILSQVGIKELSVFINAENWVTFTRYKDSDPEGIFNASSLYHYPMVKTLNVGFNITL